MAFCDESSYMTSEANSNPHLALPNFIDSIFRAAELFFCFSIHFLHTLDIMGLDI